MNEAEEKRNRLRAEQMIKAMKKRGMDAWFAESRAEALQKALELIPEGSSVCWGGSVSVTEIGLREALHAGHYQVYDRDTVETAGEKEEMMRHAFSCDYFLGSTNAVTEDGILVNIDGNGNRLAAYCWGPRHVLLITGMNKVVRTLEDAYDRARNEAAVINGSRLPVETPCKYTGVCSDCTSPQRMCSQFLTTYTSRTPGRLQIILVNDKLGF